MAKRGIFDIKRILNLENLDIVFCPLCNKDAKLPENLDGFNACIKCGGFGIIMKEKRDPKRMQQSTHPRKEIPVSY
jgi:hypothetical protein